MPTATQPDALAVLVAKAEADAFFFGHALKVYQELHGMTDDDLRRELGVWECLSSLKLCRHPRDRIDCHRVASAYGTSVDLVAAIAGVG